LHKISIKPFSANRAWKGQRFKSPEYKAFEKEMLLKLPRSIEIPDGPLKITFVFGLSSKNADGDNCVKQAQDAIAKKYGFNDKRIDHWVIHRTATAKGAEYIWFRIEASSLFLEIP
jgi:Holliday junction resolvase RusA-like endonuclease